MLKRTIILALCCMAFAACQKTVSNQPFLGTYEGLATITTTINFNGDNIVTDTVRMTAVVTAGDADEKVKINIKSHIAETDTILFRKEMDLTGTCMKNGITFDQIDTESPLSDSTQFVGRISVFGNASLNGSGDGLNMDCTLKSSFKRPGEQLEYDIFISNAKGELKRQ